MTQIVYNIQKTGSNTFNSREEIIILILYYSIQGAFHNNFPGFLVLGFHRKLAAHENSTRHRQSEQT